MASYVGKIVSGGTTLPVGSTLYGTCDTAAGTAAKVVTLANFDTLLTGVTIHVKFTYSNTVANPTLNVNSTGAKSIMRYGTTAPSTSSATSWQAGSVVSFTYDGTYWQMNGWLNDNTWPTAASAAPGNVASASSQGSSSNYARQDHTHGIALATGDSNGQVKIAGTNVSVKGLGSAAYTASTAYAASSHTHNYAGSGSAGGAANSVANSLTFNNGGSGVASGSTYNGSAAKTISYNTVGAASSGHTHTLSIASDSGTSSITLNPSTKYKLTAGGSSYIFTTPPNSTYTVNNGTLTIKQNGTSKGTFTANQSGNSTANIITDTWTSTSTVSSSGTVAFSSLDDSYGYDLYCQNKLVSVSSVTKTGSGTSTTLTYTLSGAASGDVCKLRILK